MTFNSTFPGPGQNLIIDGDDTLWENNIFFESAFEEFCRYLNHSQLQPDEIRSILDEIEIVNNKIHGYGTKNFARNLSQCYLRLAERAVEEHDLTRVISIAHQILEHEIQFMPEVEETIALLAEENTLTLFTKGNPEEQNRKIDASGLRPFFRRCEVVKEKNREAYRRLVTINGLDPARTWMVGNSPKSDINPALQAGLGAVYVPHERTWTLEREELISGERLLHVGNFGELRKLFTRNSDLFA